jgi:hypothetical protein
MQQISLPNPKPNVPGLPKETTLKARLIFSTTLAKEHINRT